MLINAQDQNAQVDKAYACFENEVGNDCGNTKSTKQNAFNLLAGSHKSSIQSSCISALKQKIKENACWGETDTGSCNIKSTALAVLSLNQVGENVNNHVNWLLSNRISEKELTWYLEIDSNNQTECNINGQKITIDNNKKILGSAPTGLVKAYNDYWFEIKDTSKNYSVSCDRDFISALLYQKKGSSSFHVSSETKSAYEFDTITESVNSLCFSTSNTCDYEGSLWATLVMSKLGEDISSYLPYLTAMSENTENKKYLPSAFLYLLTRSDDYYNELISLQKSNGYWDESRNKFYDTALALYALQSVDSSEIDLSKRYLLSNQKESGCWPSDTSFILHAAWPKNPTISGGKGSSLSACEDFGYFCVGLGECTLENKLNNFYCASSAQVCCSEDFIELTCSEKGGVICDFEQTCEGQAVSSADAGSCCIGDCVIVDTEPECEKQGYICESSCSDNEEEKSGLSSSCDFGTICCGKKPVEEKSNFWIIILLIILIILVILAIIFRNQLRMWIFRMRGGFKSRNMKPPAPPLPPRQPIRPPILGRPLFSKPAPAAQRNTERDKEFEETMKKLREMSK